MAPCYNGYSFTENFKFCSVKHTHVIFVQTCRELYLFNCSHWSGSLSRDYVLNVLRNVFLSQEMSQSQVKNCNKQKVEGLAVYLWFRLFPFCLFKKLLGTKLEDGSQFFFIERI